MTYKFVPSTAGQQFAARLKKLRELRGLSQQGLADEMTHRQGADGKPVRAQTISSWEAGHIPQLPSLNILAETFDVSTDYLIGSTKDESFRLSKSDLYQFPTKIEEADILQFEYEPLFYCPDDKDGYWTLVDPVTRTLVSIDFDPLPISDLNGTLYSMAVKPIGEKLTLSEAKEREEIYVLALGFPKGVGARLKGWYAYDKANDLFVKKDKSYAFPTDQYGSAYIGYADLPKEDR